MKTTRWTGIMLSVFTLALGACARNAKLSNESANEDVSPRIDSVAVTVTNNNLSDMKVYAVSDGGAPFRLGTVTALSSGTFTARRSMFTSGTLRLVASPIAGRGVARSGPLLVGAGRSVNFTIESNLAASFGTVQ